MQLATAEREVTGSLVLDSAEYGISPSQVAHIMGILRSSLYTRKALAVLREYGTNAWDAHREIGIFDLPIEITLPTQMRPTFVCRDFGPGMSQETVLRVYTQYGESTKRDTNDQAGALGIGSKSAFCLSDTFTITSWHGGAKSRYSAVLDRSNKGRMELLDRSECAEDETGIEIKVAVKPQMVWEFEREARQLFRYMDPQPKINVALGSLPSGLSRGWIQEEGNDWIGLMGPVPYRIDIDQISGELAYAGVTEAINALSGGIHIPLGAVEFSANREELQYTEVTNKVIVAALKGLFDEYVESSLKALSDTSLSGWERRSKASFLANSLKFPLPGKHKHLAHRAADLWDKATPPKAFVMYNHNNAETHRVPVSLQTRVLMFDDPSKSKLRGWRLQSTDVVVAPREGHTLAAARAEFEAMLPGALLDGVAIESIHIRAWYDPKPTKGSRGYHNPKHRMNCFRLTSTCGGTPYSRNWETVKRVPEDTDVFVVLSHFQPVSGTGGQNFLLDVQKDRLLAKSFGVDFPEIYGVKTTQKKPVKAKDCKGKTYAEWRVAYFSEVMSAEVRGELRTLAWGSLFQNIPYDYKRNYDSKTNFDRQMPVMIATLTEKLGAKHPVVRYFAKYREAHKGVLAMAGGRKSALQSLQRIVGSRNRPAPKLALERLLATYPMLGLRVTSDNDMWAFMTHTDLITDYILRTDRENT